MSFDNLVPSVYIRRTYWDATIGNEDQVLFSKERIMAASVKIDDLSSIKSFNPHGDPSNVGRRWRRWLKSFYLYADSKRLIIQADSADNKVQRRALLLHSAGEDVQEIFETLADTGAAADYAKAEKALNDYFIPKVNSTYQNHVFRSVEQQDGETVAQFMKD